MHRQRRERRRRRRDHPEPRRPHARRGRRCDHARQPHLAPAGDRSVSRRKRRRSSGPRTCRAASPGRGLTVVEARDGTAVAVINLLGSLFLDPARSMWEIVDGLVDKAREKAAVIVVDVHAEATSEKVGLAHVARRAGHGGGRDAHARPDLRCARAPGGHGGDHGRRDDRAARLGDRRGRATSRSGGCAPGCPVRFETASGGVRLEGALITCDPATGRASAIETVRVPLPH